MELFKLMGKISIDTDEANKAIDDTTKKAKDGEKKQSSAFSKVSKSAFTLGKGVAGVGASLGTAFIAATEGTREYRSSMGQLETAFTTGGHSASDAKKTYSDLNAVLGDTDQSTEAAQQLAKLTTNQQDLDTWTNSLTGVYATFGDALPVEGLAEAANHTAKVGEVQGNLADALEWSGVSVDDFNAQLAKCSNEQERTALITETMNDLYGKTGKKYKDVNKDVIEAEKAQTRLSDAFAKVGAILDPVMTIIKNGMAKGIEAVLSFGSNTDGLKSKFAVIMPYLQVTWQGLWTVLQTVWQTVGKPVFEFIKQVTAQLIAYWKQNWPAAAAVIRDVFSVIKNLWNSVLKPVLTILGNYVKNTLLPIWKTAFNAILKVSQVVFNGIIKLWNGSLKPILNGIISFVSGVLTGNWKKAWNGIKSIVSGVFSGIKTVISTAIGVIKSLFSSGLGAVKDIAAKIFGKVKDSISEKMDKAKAGVKKAIDKIKGFFNFKWKLPDLKLPHFSTKGKFSLNPPSVPKFSLKWNAEGGVLTEPTIFGMQGNTFLGGGEAGAEAILPVSTLKAYINESVENRNSDLIASLEIQISRLISFIQEYFPVDYKIMLDTGILAGQLAPEMDSRLADRYRNNLRGNTK